MARPGETAGPRRRPRRESALNGHRRSSSSRPSGRTKRNTEEETPLSLEDVITRENASIIRFAVAALVLAVLFIASAFYVDFPRDTHVYGIMLDAGSTGTRGQVFEFEIEGESGDLRLVKSTSGLVDKGIAVIAEGMNGKEYFEPLVKQLRELVPGRKRRAATPVFLRATAGLRLADREAVGTVLSEAKKALRESGFLFEKDDWVSILDDDEEALFGWITVNYLLGRLGANSGNGTGEPHVGILDLGGGSMQMAFHDSNPDQKLPLDYAKRINILNQDYRLISKSYLGYGLFDFTKKLYNYLETRGELEEANFCFRKGRILKKKPLRLGVAGSERTKVLDIAGDGNFTQCVAVCEEILNNGDGILEEPIVSAAASIEFYAFAYFYSRVPRFGLGETATKEQLESKGKQLCEDGNDRRYLGEVDESCAEFSYVYALLKRITRDFDGSTPIRFIQYIDGHMLGWSLGALLNELHPLLHHQLALMNLGKS